MQTSSPCTNPDGRCDTVPGGGHSRLCTGPVEIVPKGAAVDGVEATLAALYRRTLYCAPSVRQAVIFLCDDLDKLEGRPFNTTLGRVKARVEATR
jgi:hypothetical protein